MSVKKEQEVQTNYVQVEESKQVDSQVKDDGLTQDQALGVLVQAIKTAQKRGAFELEETELLLKAIKAFIK